MSSRLLKVVLGGVFFLASVPSLQAQEAKEAPKAEGNAKCFECHKDSKLTRTLGDGAKIKVGISPADFAASAHEDMDCTACHATGYGEGHPNNRKIASHEAMSAAMSKSCAECHEFDEGLHAKFATGKPYPACSTCHNPHTVKSMGEWKKKVSEGAYCLTCHSHAFPLPYSSGTSKLFSVHGKGIKSSVHKMNTCSDCHAGYSKEKHEVKKAGNKREHAVVMAKVCLRCHKKEQEVYETSMHAKLMAEGNEKAPVCTDCHGFHEVNWTSTMKSLDGQACSKCHADVTKVYNKSVHGVAARNRLASADGHDAPLCADCHSAHAAKVPGVGAQRETCKKCHEHISETHAAWLPNTELHLKAVACVVCHVVGASKRLNIELTGKSAKNALGKLKKQGDSSPSDKTVHDVLTKAHDSEFKTVLGVEDAVGAHNIGKKEDALSKCEVCHGPEFKPFKKVTVGMANGNGRDTQVEVSGGVLTSANTIFSLDQFYMLGKSRILLLDYLLLLAVFGAIGGVLVHYGARKVMGRRK